MLFEVHRDFSWQVGEILIAMKNNHSYQLQEHSLPLFNQITCRMCVILTVKHDMLTAQLRCCLGGKRLHRTKVQPKIFGVSCVWRVVYALTVWTIIYEQSKSYQPGNINWVGSSNEIWESGSLLIGIDYIEVRRGRFCLVGGKVPPAVGW